MEEMDDRRFDELMQEPYRAWIRHYHETLQPEEMQRELGGMIAGLPDVIYGDMPGCMEAAMRFFIARPMGWDTPGRDVAVMIAALADEKIPGMAHFVGKDRDSLYGAIFDVVTLFLSVQAVQSQELMRMIGL